MARFIIVNTFVLAALSFAMFRVQGQSVAVPNCARNYTVQFGDFCDTIAADQNAPTFQIQSVNNATIDAACDNLFIGEVICLGLVGHDCDQVHVVARNEACVTIISDAGISLNTLFANNPNINSGCTNIHVGEVLCVAPTVIGA